MADQTAPQPDSSEQLRSKARFRSHFWPGAGFALLGHTGLACLGTATTAFILASLGGFAFEFRPFFIWCLMASLVIYLCFYVAEQLMCRSIVIYPGYEKRSSSKFFLLLCVAGYVSLVGVLVEVYL